MAFLGGLGDIFGGLGLPDPGEVVGGFSGRTGAEAALRGAARQTALGREGLAEILASQGRLEQTLAPFLNVGTGVLGQAGQLFGADASQQVLQDPAFQAAAERAQVQLLADQASQGRLGTQETGELLQSRLSGLGSDFLSRQRGDILGAAQLGQASAAQQASSGLGSGQRASDLLTQIGNVTAAGGIGAAQSLQQGSSNVLGGLATIFGSERRLKKNIKLSGIRPDGVRIYTYNYVWDDIPRYGAMVDENPHAVVDCGTYKALDYSRL